jgi:hypothetical protein
VLRSDFREVAKVRYLRKMMFQYCRGERLDLSEPGALQPHRRPGCASVAPRPNRTKIHGAVIVCSMANADSPHSRYECDNCDKIGIR